MEKLVVPAASHLSASHKARVIETIAERFHNGIYNSPVSCDVITLAARQVTV